MGNGYKAVLAAEYDGSVYPLLDLWREGQVRPVHPIDAGLKNEALEAEVRNEKMYLLMKRPNQEAYVVSKHDLARTTFTQSATGRKVFGAISYDGLGVADYSTPLLANYDREEEWKDYTRKYEFFEAFGGVTEKGNEPGDSKNSNDIDEITGTSSNDKLKGKKVSVSLFGYKGNDKLIGSKKDDILDGGEGNDKLKGGRGADVYILSSGKDKFIGFKLQEGDTIEIDSSINFQVSSSKKDAKIIHEEGLTVVKKISASDLESAIEIV